MHREQQNKRSEYTHSIVLFDPYMLNPAYQTKYKTIILL